MYSVYIIILLYFCNKNNLQIEIEEKVPLKNYDAHGVIFIVYLEKGRAITGAYYAALLDRLVDEIRKKRPHLKKKKNPLS